MVEQATAEGDVRTDEGVARADVSTIVRIWRVVSPFSDRLRGALIAVVLCGVIASLAEGVGVGVLVLLLSAVFGGGSAGIEDDGELGELSSLLGDWPQQHPARLGALLLALVLMRIAAVTVVTLLSSVVDAKVSEQVRKTVFAHFLAMPFGELTRYHYGQLTTLLDRHAWSVAEALYTFAELLMNSIAAGVLVIFLITSSWVIAVIALVGALALSFAQSRLNRPVEEAGEELALLTQQVNSQTLRALQAMRTIRAFGQEADYQRQFDASSETLTAVSIRSERLNALSEPLSHAVYLVVLAAIALTAHLLELSYATVAAALGLLYRIHPYVGAIQANRISLASMAAGVDAVGGLLSATGVALPDGSRDVEGLQQGIAFEGLTFRYPTQAVACLDNVQFTIPARGWTILDGPSGVGKSSVVNLLLRLYEPSGGSIRIDGIPLSELQRARWLRLLAVAGQDVELIDGSIADNLRLARSDASDEQLREVARQALIADFIEGLPDGYQTRVGERGLALSGGQRQRIGIARALLRAPALLILDEATNAVDAPTEQAILDNVAHAMQGKAVLMVAHGLRAQLQPLHRIALTKP